MDTFQVQHQRLQASVQALVVGGGGVYMPIFQAGGALFLGYVFCRPDRLPLRDGIQIEQVLATVVRRHLTMEEVLES